MKKTKIDNGKSIRERLKVPMKAEIVGSIVNLCFPSPTMIEIENNWDYSIDMIIIFLANPS